MDNPMLDCACGTANKAAAKFCKACGQPLAPKSPDSWTPDAAASGSGPDLSAFGFSAPGAVPVPAAALEPAPEQPVLVQPALTPPPAPFQPKTGVPKWAWVAGAAAVVLLGLVIRAAATGPAAPVSAPLLPAPVSAPVAAAIALPADPAWFLRGGAMAGGFVPAPAQAEWPEWLQALAGDRQGVAPAELERANFYQIPDRFLVHAATVLREQKCFTPELLRQMAAISYAADTLAWREARNAYSRDYLAARPLPSGDAVTCARVLTQLALAKDYAAARSAIQQGDFLERAEERRSWLRMLDLEEGLLQSSPELVNDETHPPLERLAALISLGKAASERSLVEGFRGTPLFANAVFQGVTTGLLLSSDPLVEEAVDQAPPEAPETPWFLVPKVERRSELCWLRVMDAMGNGDKEEAARLSRSLLDRFPDAWSSGHALFLLSALGKDTAGYRPRLKQPGDVTLYNNSAIPSAPIRRTWQPPYDALASLGRFDLILARVDPVTQPEVFLAAAAAAGQFDLTGRYLALEAKASPELLPLLYPCTLAPLIERIIQEEGLTGQVEPAFVLAVIKGESLFQPWATSGAEAFGLMQLLKPTFARMMGKSAVIGDPETNIHAGLRYFKQIIKVAGLKDLPKAVRYAYILAGYHAGEGRAKAWRLANEAKLGNLDKPEQNLLRVERIPIQSTRQYLTRVLGDAELYGRMLKK